MLFYEMIDKFVSPFKPKKITNLKPNNFKIYTFNAGYKKYKDDLLVIVFDNPIPNKGKLFIKSKSLQNFFIPVVFDEF